MARKRFSGYEMARLPGGFVLPKPTFTTEPTYEEALRKKVCLRQAETKGQRKRRRKGK